MPKVALLACLLAGLMLLAMAAQPAEACSVPLIRWLPPAHGTMSVQSGKPCAIHFRSLGPTYESRVTMQPLHGSLSWNEAQSLTYRSRPGYVGSDRFAYTRAGLNSRNKRIRIKFEIAVTVTP